MIGDDRLFLDDKTLADVEREIGARVVPSGYTAAEFLRALPRPS
jgi:NifB/MoaA-like Fe-S oxidoreductase